MQIIVCIKQGTDTKIVKLNSKTNSHKFRDEFISYGSPKGGDCNNV